LFDESVDVVGTGLGGTLALNVRVLVEELKCVTRLNDVGVTKADGHRVAVELKELESDIIGVLHLRGCERHLLKGGDRVLEKRELGKFGCEGKRVDEVGIGRLEEALVNKRVQLWHQRLET